jgi:NitT/TauT family transport system ATP-binding protein
MNSDAALAIEGVSKTFHRVGKPSVEALRDINFQVQEGEFVSIVGASGSGKSTLLRIIDGLIEQSAGIVRADGAVVKRPGFDRAMVFQQDSLLPWKTVLENVAYGLTIGRKPKAEAYEIAMRFIKLVGLSGFDQHYPHQLSGGMRQRVNVARALAVGPKILLLDEPFAALDAQTREIMQTELLRIWQASKTTILLITHQIDEAVFLSDRIIVFSARPGSVRDEIKVDFARPRDLSLKRGLEFGAMVDRIWRLIEREAKIATETADG